MVAIMDHYQHTYGQEQRRSVRAFRAPRIGRGYGLAGLALGLMAAAAAQAQLRYEPLRSFGLDDQAASSPAGGVIRAADGQLYGVTSRGGSNNLGTVYVLSATGTGFRILKHFAGPDGATPAGLLLDDGSGGVYGITAQGGASTNGVIFWMDRATGQYALLHSFAANRVEGAFPLGGLTALPDQGLAGVASRGGAQEGGTLFRLSRDGEDFLVLHHFGATAQDGKTPKSRLLLASDGFLYGTTEAGGTADGGTIFRVAPGGANYEVLHRFQSATDGRTPDFGLVEGPEGWLYGVTATGGPGGLGTVYRFRPTDRQFVVLHTFQTQTRGLGYRPSALAFSPDRTKLWGTTLSGGTNDGGVFFQLNPQGGGYQVVGEPQGSIAGRFLWGELTLLPDGRLISATLSGGLEQAGSLMSWNPINGQAEVLHAFQPGGSDARTPSADLIEGADGFLYGTTSQGGSRGRGTVFRLQKDLTGYQLLHQFGEVEQDGETPVAPLVQDTAGTLYGTTAYRAGGASGGTVYKLQPDGSGYQVLKRFTNRAVEGALVVGGLTLTADGWLLGLAVEGGAFNGGTCFRLRPDGSAFAVLHAFGADDDGTTPGDGLTPCDDGYLYGILNSNGAFGGGAIFRIRADGQGYQVLHHFGRTAEDGKLPVAGLFCSSNGYLYGTCARGGQHDQGTIFRFRPGGTDYAVLHHFTPTNGAGVQPRSRLVEWADGRLYGTTASDVLSGLGTVFAIHPDGTGFSTVLRFTDIFKDGYRPWAGLTAANDGALYGTVSRGGVGESGRLFRLSNDAWVRFTGIRRETSGAQVRLTGQGVAGGRYRIERSRVVGPIAIWIEAAVVRADASGRWEWSVPVETGNTQAFFRASRVP